MVVSDALAELIAIGHPTERSPDGAPSEFDFWAGPISRATEKFGRDFDALPFINDPRIRSFTYPDPVFGAITFLGVHNLASDEIELIEYWDDPDYWSTIKQDPQ